MPVEVVDETEAASALADLAARVGRAVLECLGLPEGELCVALVDDTRIRDLNRQWRGKDRATDVLSFSQVEEGEALPAGAGEPEEGVGGDPVADAEGLVGVVPVGSGLPVLLGDVVVSVDTMRRQAAEGGWTEGEELARLVVHGVLHLVGHDHEEPSEASAMRAEEERVVRFLTGKGIACAWEDE